MPTDWSALAKLGEAAFKKQLPSKTVAPVVRRKPQPPAPIKKPITLTHWPVMFPDDDLCPEWPELVAWARHAPVAAFEILPHRGAGQNGKGLIYRSKADLQRAILAELDEAGLTVVVGLVYELRTLKERWEQQCA